MEFSEEVLFIEKFIWTKSNYKLMLGKWKIGIILEAGYQLLKSVENKESCVKPVSYTHLDVYKRQILYLSKGSWLWVFPLS